MPRTGWMNEASCRELALEAFFPTDTIGVNLARRVCAHCPTRVECLDYALENDIRHGIWGGVSERERRRIAVRRKSRTTGGRRTMS